MLALPLVLSTIVARAAFAPLPVPSGYDQVEFYALSPDGSRALVAAFREKTAFVGPMILGRAAAALHLVPVNPWATGAISNDGTIVGWGTLRASRQLPIRAYHANASGANLLPPGNRPPRSLADQSFAYGCTPDASRIVGAMLDVTRGENGLTACYWSRDGAVHFVGPVGRNVQTLGVGISDDGQTIALDRTTRPHRAYIYRSGAIAELVRPSPQAQTQVLAISGDGQVLLGALDESGTLSPALVWRRGWLSQPKMPAGSVSMTLTHLSRDGSVIVGHRTTARHQNEAVIFRRGRDPELLQKVAESEWGLAATLKGRRLTVPNGISRDGKTILVQYTEGSPSKTRSALIRLP